MSINRNTELQYIMQTQYFISQFKTSHIVRSGWGDWLPEPVLVKHLLSGEEKGGQPPPAPQLARQP
jgi:hypothetical protein